MTDRYAYLPTPDNHPELFEGLLVRRLAAFVIDSILIVFITVVLSAVILFSGIFTFGLSWFGLFIVYPATAIGYVVFFLNSSRNATPGMQQLDIVLTSVSDRRIDGWTAVFHVMLRHLFAIIFTPAVLVAGLVTKRRQLLHDLALGILAVRRSKLGQL